MHSNVIREKEHKLTILITIAVRNDDKIKRYKTIQTTDQIAYFKITIDVFLFIFCFAIALCSVVQSKIVVELHLVDIFIFRVKHF